MHSRSHYAARPNQHVVLKQALAIVHALFCRVPPAGRDALRHWNYPRCRQIRVHSTAKIFSAKRIKHVEDMKALSIHQGIACNIR